MELIFHLCRSRILHDRSGVLVIGDSKYAKAAQLNDEAAGELVAPTEGTEAIRASFPDVQFGSFGGHFGYLSTSNGWADAEGGMKALLRKVIDLGGSVKGGQTAASLLFKEDGVVRGVKTLVGDEITADVVIVATGAWTPSWVTNSCSGVVARITATGQSVACIQLTESEAECYRVSRISHLSDKNIQRSYLLGRSCGIELLDRLLRLPAKSRSPAENGHPRWRPYVRLCVLP